MQRKIRNSFRLNISSIVISYFFSFSLHFFPLATIFEIKAELTYPRIKRWCSWSGGPKLTCGYKIQLVGTFIETSKYRIFCNKRLRRLFSFEAFRYGVAEGQHLKVGYAYFKER